MIRWNNFYLYLPLMWACLVNFIDLAYNKGTNNSTALRFSRMKWDKNYWLLQIVILNQQYEQTEAIQTFNNSKVSWWLVNDLIQCFLSLQFSSAFMISDNLTVADLFNWINVGLFEIHPAVFILIIQQKFVWFKTNWSWIAAMN